MFGKLLNFIAISSFLQTNGTVLLFWGYPTKEPAHCVDESPAGVFENCIDSCLGSDLCMLAYGNDTTCILCDVFTITSIHQADSSSGTKLAIKIDQQTQCPEDVQTNEYTKSDPNGNSYGLSFDPPIWTVTYPKSCPDSTWKMFPRAVGPFCIQVTRTTSGSTRNSAVINCNKTAGAWLAGVTSLAEYNYVLGTAKSLFTSLTTYDYLSIWISGLMKSDCQPTQGTGCSGIDAFQEFPYQTTFDYYNFPTGYPNFTRRASGSVYLRCLQLVWAQQESAFDGMILNSACEYSCNEDKSICAFSYTCGVLAS